MRTPGVCAWGTIPASGPRHTHFAPLAPVPGVKHLGKGEKLARHLGSGLGCGGHPPFCAELPIFDQWDQFGIQNRFPTVFFQYLALKLVSLILFEISFYLRGDLVRIALWVEQLDR